MYSNVIKIKCATEFLNQIYLAGSIFYESKLSPRTPSERANTSDSVRKVLIPHCKSALKKIKYIFATTGI